MLLPFIIALHVAVAVLMPPLIRAMGSRAFIVASLPLVLSTAWALAQAPDIVAGGSASASVPWVPALGITLDFRLDALALAMVLLVSGVGAVIFCYSAAYFHSDERALGRLAATMAIFAGAMLGVVTTDNLFALYVFWELTSISSFVLVGHDDHKETARRAAVQALVTTAGPGLLMLIGFIVLGRIGGTYRISDLVADPPTDSTWLPLALVLVLAGAFAKSAQAPLHYWLPGAMVAPTPVSAYLHAAAMVKGGVYLIARLSPGFAEVEPWRALVLAFGLTTMVIGGWRALRQDDLKLLLAYGTVSQLGFLALLAGAGTHTAAVAAIGMLLAHGLFKSTLFLTVGIIDHQTGARTISRLSGLGRRMPLLAAAAGLAAASMAGLPPLLGFVGKEAALEAFVPGHAPEMSQTAALVMLIGLVFASILTFAYSARFFWGAFADKATVSERRFTRPSGAFLAAPVLLSALGLALGVLPFLADPIASGYALAYDDHGKPYHLALWHGLTPALGLSALIVVVGAVLFWRRKAVAKVQNAMPRWPDAEVGYHLFLHTIYSTALSVTRRTQSGSLPIYLGIILAVLLALPGVRLLAALVNGSVEVPGPDSGFRLWDSPLEFLIALIIVVTAIATVREHRRFPALILISALGFGIAGLFVLHGAPDLALTLVLVETLTTIILVFVLRRLPTMFGTRPDGWPKRLTVAMCVAAGTFIAVSLWLMTHARTDPPISRGFAPLAVEAGGTNLVNMILADFRALDTFGEIVVLVTAAVAVASLVLLNRRSRVVEEPDADVGEDEAELATRAPQQPVTETATLGTRGGNASEGRIDDSARPDDERR
ncbi:multicomponent Na+:H+ antiporter subunit A [Spinactinospora alkalitolerans]|uniref:Multicomponent Na+:H+ antiporter subunit A n=1 Tax=Spinactinospora alkalitolerans TaxID=687207 RepID=A0A852TU94_9ACTN|nr:hydrogen gas-evolving membrane-bound hydrogenase subunit E [Spinactinospora alkalitolerans]NYE46442.1 multicomponent Na+:H+ antiporter subunit A [Spinactinospora alkalitolerans]